MRLIVMGQQAFGKDVLAKLLETGTDEVVAVYCEPDKDGKPVDPIKEFAQEKGLPVHQPANFNDQETLDTLASYNADLMIMAFVNVFVPEAARDTPAYGSICFHPSLLPLHRGPSAVNWPIIMGSTKSGYSWFYPSDGLDEGDCLLQWECEIGPDDTVIDLYFKKIYPHAVESVLTVCDHYRDGNPPRIVADESQATYERRCNKNHARIEWHRPVKQVYDLIRGTNPAPGHGQRSTVPKSVSSTASWFPAMEFPDASGRSQMKASPSSASADGSSSKEYVQPAKAKYPPPNGQRPLG